MPIPQHTARRNERTGAGRRSCCSHPEGTWWHGSSVPKRAEHGHVQAALARAQLLPLCLAFPFHRWALSIWCSVEFCHFQPKPSLGSHPQGPSVRPRAGSRAGAQGGWNGAGQGTQWPPSSLHIPTALPPPPPPRSGTQPREHVAGLRVGLGMNASKHLFLAGISGFLQFLVAVFL